MVDDVVTIDGVLAKLEEWVKERHPIDAHTWLQAASQITVLLGGEHEKLFTLQQRVAASKAYYIKEQDFTAARANIELEASDLYKEMRIQEAKIKRIEELVRISKIQARLADREMGLQ